MIPEVRCCSRCCQCRRSPSLVQTCLYKKHMTFSQIQAETNQKDIHHTLHRRFSHLELHECRSYQGCSRCIRRDCRHPSLMSKFLGDKTCTQQFPTTGHFCYHVCLSHKASTWCCWHHCCKTPSHTECNDPGRMNSRSLSDIHDISLNRRTMKKRTRTNQRHTLNKWWHHLLMSLTGRNPCTLVFLLHPCTFLENNRHNQPQLDFPSDQNIYQVSNRYKGRSP